MTTNVARRLIVAVFAAAALLGCDPGKSQPVDSATDVTSRATAAPTDDDAADAVDIVERQTVLAARLPAVEALILAKDWECQTGGCYTAFTTDEARALAAALDAAGFDESVDADQRLAYAANSAPTQVVLRPRHPHEVGVGPIPG
jgi:hypothetical protein